MMRFLVASAVVLGVSSATAWAQPAPQADCSKFQRMTDGRWTSTIDAKIGNPKDFKRLQPGLPIDRSLTIVGLNVSDTLDRLCGGR